MERVEIVTRGEAQREYTLDERAAVLTEATMPGARVLLVAQRHGISPSLVYCWRREAAGRPARQAPPRAPRFVPLLADDGGTRQGAVVPPSAPLRDAGTDRVEVVLRNGRLLRVGAGMDAVVVARLAAALAALSEPWSNGPTEEHITKLKLIRRQMYGHGKLDLLRTRLVVPA